MDAIFSVDPLSELEPELTPVTEEAKLEAAKTRVAIVKGQSMSLISNPPNIIKAINLLINSSITEDHKTILANIRDQLPFFVSNIRLVIQVEEENTKKLETRKANTVDLITLKTKFELAKAKKIDLE